MVPTRKITLAAIISLAIAPIVFVGVQGEQICVFPVRMDRAVVCFGMRINDVSAWTVRWVPAMVWLACLVLPAIWVSQFFAQLWRRIAVVRRAADGLCAGCGYDLRASRQRCPECGLPIAHEARRPQHAAPPPPPLA